MTNQRPSFLKSYFRFASEVVETKPWRLVPFWFVVGLGAGGASAWFMPAAFWGDERWDVSVTVYSAFLAFNGLLLALGWNAFSKMYEVLSAGEYADFLKRQNILLEHLFFIEIVHNTLVISVIASGVGLISLMFPFSIALDRWIMAAVIGLSLYALAKALSAIRGMNDLLWDKAHYPAHSAQNEHRLRAVNPQGNGQ